MLHIQVNLTKYAHLKLMIGVIVTKVPAPGLSKTYCFLVFAMQIQNKFISTF